MIKTRRPLYKALNMQFTFNVEAMDNYGRENGLTHKSYARVVISILSDESRFILGISGITPMEMQKHKNKLRQILNEKSNEAIAEIEKITFRKITMQNNTIIERKDSTDVFFYFVNPKTESILPRNATPMTDLRFQNELISLIFNRLRLNVEEIYFPLEMDNDIYHHLEISNSQENEGIQYSLITSSALIILVIIVGVYALTYCNR